MTEPLLKRIVNLAIVLSLVAVVAAVAPERPAFAQTTEDQASGETTTTENTSTEGTTTEPTGEVPTEPPADGSSTTTEDPVNGPSTETSTEQAPLSEPTADAPVEQSLVDPIPVPQNVVDALLAEIEALGVNATPAELELAALLSAGEIASVTALADYLVANDSLALLNVVSETLLASGDLAAAQAIIPHLLDAGLIDSAVAIVQAVIAQGDVAGLLPLLPDVLDALAAAGETDQIIAIVTELLSAESLSALLADPANTALLTALFESLVEAGQAGVLADLVPGLVNQLLAAGDLQQVVALITALADSGALAELPGLLSQIVTPQLLQALLADPANTGLLTALFESLVEAGQAGVLADLVPGLVNQLLAAGDLQQVVALITALADSGALTELPGLLSQIVTPQLLQALLADPANTALLTALFESLVEAGQAGVLADLVPGLVNQLLAAGDLQQVVALITALADSGALVVLPGLLTQLLTPQLFQALLADPANLEMVVDLLSSVVQALVDAGPELGIVAAYLPSLINQLQGVVDLIDRLVMIVQPLAGPVITVVGPVADSTSVERLITPVVSTSLFGTGFTGTPSLVP